MKWLIIGSVAAKHHFPDFRDPGDIDVLTPAKIECLNPTKCLVDTSWHNAAQYMMDINTCKTFLDKDLLYTLKVSHASYNIKWKKTMFDINFFKQKGCKLNYKVLRDLENVWLEIHGKKPINLNQKVDDFFTDKVDRIYNHEWLHEQVAFYDRPLHESIRPDLTKAWCSQELFVNLTAEQQFEICLEEIIVTAIERRKLTLASTKIEILSAVNYAYYKLCTTMTKGWFSLFLILNEKELLIDRREKWHSNLVRTLNKISCSQSLTL
jgi:hypothetical protein